MARKIFEVQTIDFSTGEIKSIKTTTVDKFKERFSMCRTTNGVEWVKDFSGKELQMIIVLNNMENLETHRISLTPLSREDIFKFFEITKSTFSHIINDMEEKRFLLRLSKSDLLLNPSFFYKGESVYVAERIKNFNNLYDERRQAKTKNGSE